MASTIAVERPPNTSVSTKFDSALLIAAPLIMAAGRALLVPLDDQDWDAVMSSMAANQGRSDTGWLLALSACGLLGVTAVQFAHRLRSGGRQRTAYFAMITIAIGWAATAAICASGLYLSTAAGASDRAAQVRIQEEFNGATSIDTVFLLLLIACIGYVVLAVGLARSSVLSRGASILLAVGGIATMITMGGPLTPLLVLAALLLTAGHALALRDIDVA